MTTYAASTRAVEPAARPSRPSVRFTPFADAVMITNTQAKNAHPRNRPVSRMKEIWSLTCV